MGLFSSKKKTYVSSVVYNMAGPEENRPNYLKSIVLGNILTNSGNPNFSLGRAMRDGYMSGPGFRLKRYTPWAKENYKLIGVPTDSFISQPDYNETIISQELNTRYGYDTIINWIEAGRADVTYWARQWLYDNNPEAVETDWTADFVEASGDVMISFPDGSFTLFTPNGFLINSSYLYISFSRVLDDGTWLAPSILIYRIGSGSAVLDSQFVQSKQFGQYLPYIPVRYESKFLSESYLPDLYAQSKDAYKKSIGGKFDELVDQLKDNDSIDDIDFAYVSFGVLLNTKEETGLEYLFLFFDRLRMMQDRPASEYDSWTSGLADYDGKLEAWENWYEENKGLPPEQQSPMPVRAALPSMPSNTIRIRKSGTANTYYDMEISWSGITRTEGTGLIPREVPDKHKFWFTMENGREFEIRTYSTLETALLSDRTVVLNYQVDNRRWVKLAIHNLMHKNYVYDGKSVDISGFEALTDTDESGFLVPLENGILKQMGLVKATQLSTCAAHLVLNSYQIVKKKWYQRGWFKVFLVIAVIVITVVTGGIGAGSVGLLGANAAVGASLGFVGLAATIAGAVANMVAAMIITKLITVASTAIFGEKIGAIVAAIAAFVTLQVGSAMQAGQTLASSFSSMMNATNLLHLTNSVGSGIAGFMAADAQEYVGKTQELLEDYKTQSKEIQDLYAENIGYATTFFDPMSLMSDRVIPYESADSFLGRTLMTGSDIAEMSVELVSNFSEITLNPQLP